MAQQKQITLRNVKGSALTYEEMDKNLSSFFHSASLSGTNLLLHYTGSTVLGPDYIPSSISVPLNPLLATITQLQVAGNNEGDIQYRIDDSTLGANTSFKWDTNNYRLGVGVPSPEATIHVIGQTEPTTVRISATTANKQANIDFTSPIGLLGSFGKTRTNSSNIFIDLPNISGGGNLITTVGGTNITRTNSTGLGIFTGTSNPNKALTVVGIIGVGSDIGQNQGQIGNIVVGAQVKVAETHLPLNSGQTGLLIESPFKSTGAITGGHVVVGINKTGTTANTSFSVIAGANGIYNTPIITAKADNKVGINKPNPSEALDIIGNTTMTGSINVTGTATIITVADSQGANPKVLTVNGSGLVQYANNLMPKGGIIMWGGTIPNIPTGWKLCDGNNGTPVNGVTIPDLRERFIVGAGGTGDTLVATRLYDRTGNNYNDYSFLYFGSLVLEYTQKVNTTTVREFYTEFYSGDPNKVAANGNPLGSYHMYDTGGNYFYYLDYAGKIQKGNTRDFDGNLPRPSGLPTQPATWTGDVGFDNINQYSQAYGYYHVYQKKFSTNAIPATGNDLWYWIFDKRTQNYVLVRGTFNGDASIGTGPTVGYKTGMSVGISYTPFQKYKNPGVPAIDTNNRPSEYNAKRIQIPGIVWAESGYSVGDKGGLTNVQITNTTMPTHSHISSRWSGNQGDFETSNGGQIADGMAIQNFTATTFNAGGDQPHENRPPYYALAFIIYTGVQ